MRQIGTIPRLEQAQLFADYLAALDIDAITEQQDSQWAIWVRDEDAREKAKEHLQSYLSDPDSPEFEKIAAPIQAARIRKQEELLRRADEAINNQAVRTENPSRVGLPAPRNMTFRQVARQAPLTVTIMLLCTLTWISSNMGQDLRSSSMESLSFCHPIRVQQPEWQVEEDGTQDIRRGELWRLVTPAFLHFGIAHLGLNVFFLFQLGWLFETKISTERMGLVVLASAIIGNVGQYVCDGWPIFGGLSGAVSGLVGYLSVRMIMAPEEDGPRITPIAVLLILLSIGLAGSIDQLANDSIGNDIKIANWAQFFGVITGGLLAAALPRKKAAEDSAALRS